MSKICPVTGKKVMSGNNVSHANNKTRRKFNINMQPVSLVSEVLGRSVSMRMTARGLKTIEFHGGLDAYLLRSPASKLTAELKSLRKIITERQAAV
jgi:large subunit ribosomal protein L28